MLPVDYRLPTADVKRLFRRGEKIHTPYFVVSWDRSQDKYPRFGFVASKKVGNAVARHRAVRILREAVRATVDAFPQGVNFVFFARSSIAGKKMSAIQSEVERLAQKVHSKI